MNGITRTPLQFANHKAAVLIFVGVDCPISNSYAPKINRLISDYSKQPIDFYIVYSDSKLSPADAKKHVADFGFTCPALLDRQQRLMNKVHATVTPEAAVVDPRGQVVYLGRIDNWYEDFGKQRYSATTHELRDALDAVLAGKKSGYPCNQSGGLSDLIRWLAHPDAGSEVIQRAGFLRKSIRLFGAPQATGV